MRPLARLAVLLLCAVAIAAPGGKASKAPKPPKNTTLLAPTPVSLAAASWINWLGPALANDAEGALTFVFPAPPKLESYLYTGPQARYALTGFEALVADIEIMALAGAPQFVYPTSGNPCPTPASVRLYLQAGSGYKDSDQFDRWWHRDGVVLAPGVWTLEGDLTDLTAWSSVYGLRADASAAATAAFRAVLADAQVGMTFGGGCFYGHGVSVTGGTARFRLTGMEAQ